MKAKYVVSIWFLMAGAFSAYAQEKPQKIGTLNMDYVLSALPEIKAIQSQLATLQTQLKKQGAAKEKQYKEKYINYQMDGANMTLGDRQKLETELASMEDDIKSFGNSAQEKLQNKQAELMKPINQKVSDALEAVVKENNFTHVFNVGVPQAGVDILYYVDPAYDVSNLVLKKLGVEPPVSN